MSIIFESVGTVGIGSTTVTPGVPADGLITGDLCLIIVVTKPDTAAITTPTNWTLVGVVSGGGGTVGNGTGPTKCAVFSRIKDSSWSTMPAVAITSGNSSAAIAVKYSNATGLWNLAASSGSYSGNGTAWSATTGSNPGITSNDLCLIACSNQDEAPTWSAQALAATGVTFGTLAERTEALETTTGNDVGGMVCDVPATSGTSTASPVFTATTSAASRGNTLVVRLREDAGQSHTSTPADTEALTDIVSRVLDSERTPVDTENITETVSTQSDYNRTPSDTEDVTDSVVVEALNPRTTDDTVNITDTVDSELLHVELAEVSDAEVITDSVLITSHWRYNKNTQAVMG